MLLPEVCIWRYCQKCVYGDIARIMRMALCQKCAFGVIIRNVHFGIIARGLHLAVVLASTLRQIYVTKCSFGGVQLSANGLLVYLVLVIEMIVLA